MARKQRFPHLLGSKWTARARTFGWRHFQVVNRKNQGKWVYAELEASCDRDVRFWINAKSLKDRELWEPGWTPLNEMAPSGETPLPEVDDLSDLEPMEHSELGDLAGGDPTDSLP
jgi:tryptophan-rich hypothetical protein